jgi:hypothetical protein
MEGESVVSENTEKPKGNRSCLVLGLVLGVVFVFVVIGAFIYQNFFIGNSSSVPIIDDIKDQNPSDNPSVDPADLLNYFVETTTYYGKDSKRYPLSRWTINPITISIDGNVNNETLLAFGDAITEFNAVSDTKLQIVSSGSNIKVHYLPIEQFPAYADIEAVKGYMRPTTQNCRFSSADVYVDDTRFEDSSQLTYHDALLLVTRHELMHAVGFTGHDNQERGCTSLTSVACLIDEYTQYDISAIKMLYNSEIPLCSNESEIRQYFSGDIPT